MSIFFLVVVLVVGGGGGGFRVCSDSQWRCQMCPAGTVSSSGGRGSAVVPTMRVLGGTGVPGE